VPHKGGPPPHLGTHRLSTVMEKSGWAVG
jgi:hypothetical protein